MNNAEYYCGNILELCFAQKSLSVSKSVNTVCPYEFSFIRMFSEGVLVYSQTLKLFDRDLVECQDLLDPQGLRDPRWVTLMGDT